MTRATRPVAGGRGLGRSRNCGRHVSVTPPAVASAERVGATDDLADFLGDFGLAGRVGKPGERLDELSGVVGRRLHRALAGGVLGGGRLQQRVVDPALDVRGSRASSTSSADGSNSYSGRISSSAGLLLALVELERQQPVAVRRLRHHRDELGEDDVDLVHAALRRVRLEERLDQRRRDLLGVRVLRLVGEAGPRLRDLALAEAVVRHALAADDVRDDLLALAAQPLGELLRRLDRVGGVGAGQTAVAGDEQHRGPGRRLGLGGQRVLDVRAGRHRRDRAGELARVRRGGRARAAP